VFGQLRPEVATKPVEGIQLRGRHLELGSKAFGHLWIEPDIAAAAPLQAVLGDASAKVGRTLANGFEGRVAADSATVTHRERVLPGRKQRLEL